MSLSQVEPHGKMRSRDVNKVARVEQARKPACPWFHLSSSSQANSISTPPPTPPTRKRLMMTQLRLHRQIPSKAATATLVTWTTTGALRRKEKNAAECHKFAKHYKSLCPVEYWIERWDEQREHGTFHGQI